MNALLISPRYTSLDWQALDSSNPKDWLKAADIIRDRLDGRFLRFASICLKDKHSGFVVLAIDCLLEGWRHERTPPIRGDGHAFS